MLIKYAKIIEMYVKIELFVNSFDIFLTFNVYINHIKLSRLSNKLI